LRASPTESRPLPQALGKLVQQWKAAGLNITLHISGNVRLLSPETNLTLYRAAQEGLTNVARHAHANGVDVTLEYESAQTTRLRVKDDGVGSKNSEGGFGLLGV
jgi:signal transduction histidine kinase